MANLVQQLVEKYADPLAAELQHYSDGADLSSSAESLFAAINSEWDQLSIEDRQVPYNHSRNILLVPTVQTGTVGR